jgi:uncharacterized membrane protein
MESFHVVINFVGLGLNAVGALITVWGIAISLVDFVRKEIVRSKDCVTANETIRLKLGSYLVLALEIFIASDIVKTVVTPSWEGLGILGAIVVIRTILSYFLTRDLKKL